MSGLPEFLLATLEVREGVSTASSRGGITGVPRLRRRSSKSASALFAAPILLAGLVAADVTYSEGGAMGASVQVDVTAADVTSIHCFDVFSSQSNLWTVRIDDLAE
ncbi:MAG: hypothetical protein ACOH1T_12305 [Microbacteriaceae bacterium]